MSGKGKRRRPCDQCGAITQAVQTCLPCQIKARPPVRPTRPCIECEIPTQATSQVCVTCRGTERQETRPCVSCNTQHRSWLSELCVTCRTPGMALEDGRWVQRGLIQVWAPEQQWEAS